MGNAADKLKGVDRNQKMSVREYKNMMQGKLGKNTINDSMLESMDRATGGSGKAVATVDQLHQMNTSTELSRTKDDPWKPALIDP